MERKKKEKNSKPLIKKPLNAFMLYMKEQRAKVVSECTLKESATINQILGRKVKIFSWQNQPLIVATCLRKFELQIFLVLWKLSSLSKLVNKGDR